MSTFELISTNELLGNLQNSDFRIFDVSTSLIPSVSGVGYDALGLKRSWVASRIPNSLYLDVIKYLSEPTDTIRYGVPAVGKMTDFMSEYNLGYDDQIILYERSPSIWAPRIWWILKYYGFKNVKILDCYLDHWVSLNLPLESGSFQKETKKKSRQSFVRFNINAKMWISKQDVQYGLLEKKFLLLNTLSPEVFLGSKARYGKAGHIPGSINVHYKLFTTEARERFLSESVCKNILSQFIQIKEDMPIVLYCGGGVSACFVAFVIRNLFVGRQVSVYDGSLIEWMSSDSNPVNTSST